MDLDFDLLRSSKMQIFEKIGPFEEEIESFVLIASGSEEMQQKNNFEVYLKKFKSYMSTVSDIRTLNEWGGYIESLGDISLQVNGYLSQTSIPELLVDCVSDFLAWKSLIVQPGEEVDPIPLAKLTLSTLKRVCKVTSGMAKLSLLSVSELIAWRFKFAQSMLSMLGLLLSLCMLADKKEEVAITKIFSIFLQLVSATLGVSLLFYCSSQFVLLQLTLNTANMAIEYIPLPSQSTPLEVKEVSKNQ